MKKVLMTAAVCLMAAMTVAAAQCMAKTQDGSPCKREAVEGRKLCWQHAKAADALGLFNDIQQRLYAA